MMKFLFAILTIIIGMLALLYFLSPARPVEWRPDMMSSLTGSLAKNNKLDVASLVNSGIKGPEDITVDNNGWLHTGLKDGRIVKFHPSQPSQIVTLANTGGRPLGLRFDANGNLIVADAVKGLLSLSPNGNITVLASTFNGKRLLLVDHLDIAQSGDIYFSDASARFGLNDYILDFIEASASGRVFKYAVNTGEISLLLDGLFFSNGIVLGPNDDYLIVAETGRSRLLKYYLNGDRAGQYEVFLDALPAMPDNLYFDENETIWVGLVAMRNQQIEKLAAYPGVRRLLGAVPANMLKPIGAYGFVIGVNLNGKITHNFQTEQGYKSISAAFEHEGSLYLGSLEGDGIAKFDLP